MFRYFFLSFFLTIFFFLLSGCGAVREGYVPVDVNVVKNNMYTQYVRVVIPRDAAVYKALEDNPVALAFYADKANDRDIAVAKMYRVGGGRRSMTPLESVTSLGNTTIKYGFLGLLGWKGLDVLGMALGAAGNSYNFDSGGGGLSVDNVGNEWSPVITGDYNDTSILLDNAKNDYWMMPTEGE